MDIYKQYIIKTTDEVVLALLAQYDFEAFEEQEYQSIAYISQSSWSSEIDEAVKSICSERKIKLVVEDIQPQNWNAEWEKNFSPVDIHDFCTIRADFHEKPEGFQYTLLLQPKMAFGTGHHETTFMMINQMSKIKIEGQSVLDYGCGTGILAILAKKMNSGYTLAIDIEEESYQNTLENASKNGVVLDKTLCGTIEDVPPKAYDIILANINRHVLLSTAEQVLKHLKKGGVLLMSGILDQDEALIVEKYQSIGMQLVNQSQKGSWLCLQWTY